VNAWRVFTEVVRDPALKHISLGGSYLPGYGLMGTKVLLPQAVDGEPNAGRVARGEIDSVTHVGRYEPVVSRPHGHRSASVVGEGSTALQQHHPFILALVIPFAGRGGLPGRKNVLKP
jgi:hypothetical protein